MRSAELFILALGIQTRCASSHKLEKMPQSPEHSAVRNLFRLGHSIWLGALQAAACRKLLRISVSLRMVPSSSSALVASICRSMRGAAPLGANMSAIALSEKPAERPRAISASRSSTPRWVLQQDEEFPYAARLPLRFMLKRRVHLGSIEAQTRYCGYPDRPHGAHLACQLTRSISFLHRSAASRRECPSAAPLPLCPHSILILLTSSQLEVAEYALGQSKSKRERKTESRLDHYTSSWQMPYLGIENRSTAASEHRKRIR